MLGLSAACFPALAQDAVAGGRSTSLSASVSAGVSYVDTHRTTGGVSGSDLVLQVSPGLQVSSRSGRVQGSLSYSLSAIQHTRRTDESELQNALSASMVAEAIQNFAFVDASASISQRSLSPFGQQSANGSLQSNSNRTEVGTVSLSPYVRGALGTVASYEVRLNASATNGRHSKEADSTATGASASLNSASSGSVFGWGLQATNQVSDFRTGRKTESDRFIASLSAVPDPELRFTLRGGQEANNVASLERRTTNNWGVEAQWAPNERTSANVATDQRYFGRSYSISLSHRLPQSSFRFTSTRDASSGADPNGVGRPLTLYQLIDFQLLSAFPDPAVRDVQVRNFIASLSRDPNEIVAGGFINSGVTLQRREDLAWTYNGRRLTLTLQAFAGSTSRIDDLTQPAGDEPVRQRGYTGSVSYRLTPTATASLTGSQLKTLATATQGATNLRSLALSWTDQLGPRTSATVSARYALFDSPADPYRESSINASLNFRF